MIERANACAGVCGSVCVWQCVCGSVNVLAKVNMTPRWDVLGMSRSTAKKEGKSPKYSRNPWRF